MSTHSGQFPATKSTRIVVADDDEDMRELVGNCLREQGYDVQEVADGSQLLVRVEDCFVFAHDADAADLFVTDIHMPGYTGLEIVTGLREAGMKTPVIIMTAFGDTALREQAESLGAAFLRKPFDVEDLLATVRSSLSRKAS